LTSRLASPHRAESGSGGAPWWLGLSVGQLLQDFEHREEVASAAPPPPDVVADDTVAARLVAILRWGELFQESA
jgi:hypothetical protein